MVAPSTLLYQCLKEVINKSYKTPIFEKKPPTRHHIEQILPRMYLDDYIRDICGSYPESASPLRQKKKWEKYLFIVILIRGEITILPLQNKENNYRLDQRQLVKNLTTAVNFLSRLHTPSQQVILADFP